MNMIIKYKDQSKNAYHIYGPKIFESGPYILSPTNSIITQINSEDQIKKQLYI